MSESTYDAQYHGRNDLDQDWTESPFSGGTYEQEQAPMLGEMPHHPLHVKVVDTQNQNVAAEFTAWSNQQPVLAGSGVATQLCPHRYHRDTCKMIINVPATTTVYFANKPDALSSPAPPSTVAQLTGPLTNFRLPDYEGQQPLYAVYTGTGPVTVFVQDETYGIVQ